MSEDTFGGYLTYLKTMNVKALQATFANDYPVSQLRDVHVSIEYPIEPAHYPGIWVDYSDVGKLTISGVAHEEYADTEGNQVLPYTRWKFSGYVSYTVTALTSRERDGLYDELIKVLAFGKYDPARSRFRKFIETNPFIAANMDFDEIEPQGNAAAPGTPWGTDEIIYERTINMEIVGEFVSSTSTGELLRLSQVLIVPHVLGEDEEGDLDQILVPQGDGPSDWH